MKVDISFSSQLSSDYSVYINELNALRMGGKVAIITNPKISNLHLETLKEHLRVDECHVITIPDGEHYKNLKTVESILDQLFELKLNRSSTLIAFGGGVIGDITGFCASIYQRGISFIQIPTSLLAQVDSSVGGKTGVNNSYGKNLIGSFYQPKAVYCQTDFLKTLPERDFAAGIAEIIKMAITFDMPFFEWLERVDLRDETIIGKAISRAIAIKAAIVSKDEREIGLRAVLNYGHTFGHVIEMETKYQEYLHGESVAMGINMANQLAMELGILTLVEHERICEVLQRYDLPLSYTIKDPEAFYAAFYLDKKSGDDEIKFILPVHIGGYTIRDNIPKEKVIEVLRKFT